jgi:CcmD family protein
MRNSLKALVVLLVLCAMPVLMPASAIAHDQYAVGTAPVTHGSDPEANLPYLYAVYTVTWVAFFAYVFYLSQKQRDMRREVEELRRALAERDGQD